MAPKRLLTILLLLPFIGISGVAVAAQHRVSEVGCYAPCEGFAMERKKPRRRVARQDNSQKNRNPSKSCYFDYHNGPILLCR